MRILFVLHQFFPEFHGGTERVTLNLAKVAQRAGHYVHILAGTVDPSKSAPDASNNENRDWLEATFDGLPLTLIDRSLLPATSEIGFDFEEHKAIALREWMNGLHFDVAHVMHSMRMGAALRALQLTGLPYVLTLTDFFLPCARVNMMDRFGGECHGPRLGAQCAKQCLVPPWTSQSYADRFEQSNAILAGASARVVPSDYVAKKFLESYPRLDFLTIPHGVDLLNISAANKTPFIADSGARVGLKLVFIGSIVVQKGLHILLKALSKIPEAQLSLTIGGGFFCDAVYRREIESAIAADNRVKWVGALDDRGVAAVLADADLLCLPSLVPETFSLVLHESAAAGVPALVSNLGAPANFLHARECGRVVTNATVEAWVEAISEALNSPQLITAWRKNLFLPLRVEEEAFYYESIYKRISVEATA